MSDLSSNNCGCGGGLNLCSGNNWIWLLLILSGIGGNGIFGSNNGCGCSGNNNSSDWILWILLLSAISGGNNNCGCGCGCN
ncbi:MAG: chorion class high-cysteine HCB protein 13 [Lachnospiraceae bacterium]|nr:chorion class high-cysteine HCB protein 13 [Lachnospiraceae bacterium]